MQTELFHSYTIVIILRLGTLWPKGCITLFNCHATRDIKVTHWTDFSLNGIYRALASIFQLAPLGPGMIQWAICFALSICKMLVLRNIAIRIRCVQWVVFDQKFPPPCQNFPPTLISVLCWNGIHSVILLLIWYWIQLWVFAMETFHDISHYGHGTSLSTLAKLKATFSWRRGGGEEGRGGEKKRKGRKEGIISVDNLQKFPHDDSVS